MLSNNNFKKIHLKTAIIVPFVTLTVLTVSIVGYLSYIYGQKSVNDVALQLRSNIIKHIENHLLNFLKTPQQINQLNAVSIEHGLLNINNIEIVEHHFWTQIKIFKDVTSIYFGNTEGGLVNSGREGATDAQYIIVTDDFKSGSFRKFATDKKGNRGKLIMTVNNFDARKRQWYIKAVDKGTGVWCPVYILFTGQDLAIAASRPVYDDHNNLLGVTSVDLFLSHISNFLNKLSIGKSGCAFIMERSGLIIATSNKEKLFTNPSNKKDQSRLKAIDSEMPLIRFSAESLLKQFGDFNGITNKHNIAFTLSGQNHYLQVSPVQDEYGLDWLIVVVIPEADFIENLKTNNMITLVLIIITLSIALLIGFFTARKIAIPILRITDAALSLAKGELKQKIHDNSQLVEIKTLTQSFNQMATQLQQMLIDLNHEIIERKQIESALRKNEVHLRTLIEAIPDFVWLKDPTGVYISCNRKFERFFGANKVNIIGKTDYDFVDNELADFFRKKDKEVLLAKKPLVNEEEVTYADDGHREILETIKTPMYDLEGNLIGVLGIARDITQRKRTENALRKEKEFIDKVLNTQHDTFFLYDPINRKAIRWNQSFKRISGYTDEEIANMKALDACYSPEDLNKATKFIQKVFKEGVGTIEFELICKNGCKVPTEYSVSVITDDYNNSKYFIFIGRDITERKKAELQEQQSQKMEAIGTLAGGIAHDFNNMLGIFTGNISYALSILNKDDELFEILSDVIQATKQAKNLTQQLLTFAKGGEPIKKPNDMNKLLQESAKFVTSGANSKCVFQLADDLFTAEVDSGQINQIISNIIINADQAMPDGGIITIRTENTEIQTGNDFQLPEGYYIKICIEDQGIGIQEKHISNIFDPYFTTKQRGSGLGLATTYSIIKKHGGHITVYSEVEKGTIFNIYLPASARQMIKTEDKKQSKHQGQGRILIMDDQEMILKVSGKLFGLLGYETDFARDGKQAISLYKQAFQSGHPFHLVVLDLTIPGGMGGAETISELLKIDPKVKAIVSSGYSTDPVMANYQDYGFCGVLPKPFTKAEVTEVVSSCFS